ncbi:MAG: VWA domain-containing protein [Deltaproteobacteria bacterium]|nr:VWA domain-containing protein [Deltaproteobacteria bacterium]
MSAFARALLVGLVALSASGCVDPKKDPLPIEGSTYRISRKSTPVTNEQSQVEIKILTSRDECAQQLGLMGQDLEDCIPRVDRATGETTLSFTLKDSTLGTPVLLPLHQEQVLISHMDRKMQSAGEYELIPRDPLQTGQLFILLIDGSGSMYENDGERAKKVYQALLNKQVVERFFAKSDTARNGVVLLRFSNEVQGLDGGPAQVLTKPAQYKQMVQGHLMQRSGGYTHLYSAVEYAVTDLLGEPAIREWLQVNMAEPTVVLITDGFNNETAQDVCADNVPRLEHTLDVLRQARGAAGQSRPTLFTVGLGKAIRSRYTYEKNRKLNGRELCGPHGDRRINNDLENYGIDNVSLTWLAEEGGGSSFVKSRPKGLAEVFQAAAAERYRWYTARYRLDGFYHRQSYFVRISLLAYAVASSTVDIHPSGWLDAPSGEVAADQWTRPGSMGRALAFLMPLLGGLLLLSYLGPAVFNARRAIFRRARKR